MALVVRELVAFEQQPQQPDRLDDEVGQVAPALRRGGDEAPVLDEAAGVDQVGQVLPRGTPAAGVPEPGEIPLGAGG